MDPAPRVGPEPMVPRDVSIPVLASSKQKKLTHHRWHKLCQEIVVDTIKLHTAVLARVTLHR
jgi:hypothetical protein